VLRVQQEGDGCVCGQGEAIEVRYFGRFQIDTIQSCVTNTSLSQTMDQVFLKVWLPKARLPTFVALSSPLMLKALCKAIDVMHTEQDKEFVFTVEGMEIKLDQQLEDWHQGLKGARIVAEQGSREY
jgi:hypothetical protein